MLVSLSRTTPAISSAMLGQSSRDTEVAHRLVTQALLHPVDKTVDEDLFQSGIRRGRRICAHGCERHFRTGRVAAGDRAVPGRRSVVPLAFQGMPRGRLEAPDVLSGFFRRRVPPFLTVP